MKSLMESDFYMTAHECPDDIVDHFDHSVKMGHYNIYYVKSKAELVENSVCSVLIVGDYVQADLESPLGKLTLTELCSFKSGPTLELIYQFVDTLVGTFVCFARVGGGFYIIPDATASLPTYYSSERHASVISSVEMLLKKYSLLSTSSDNEDIKSILASLSLGQVLPYDLCVTPGVRCLLPNHYLSLDTMTAFRRHIDIEERALVSLSDVAEKSIGMIGRAVKYYSHKYVIKCPLTGGLDSRVVALSLNKFSGVNEAYTFQHQHLTQDSPDIELPPIISAKLGFKHVKIFDGKDGKDGDEDLEGIWEATIAYPKYKHTINNAKKIRSIYPHGTAITPGDIIGQIGKSSVGGCISNRLFTPRILRAKTHYISSKGLIFEKIYLDKLGESKGALSDFYAWEIRCGKWATRTSDYYRRVGIVSLNLFNCTNLIRLWCSVPRKLRVSGELHAELIKQLAPPDMHMQPINGKRFSIHANSNVFYGASLAKYYYVKAKSLRR